MTDLERRFMRFLGWLLLAALWTNACGAVFVYSDLPGYLVWAALPLTVFMVSTSQRWKRWFN